jgi:hypothetical protein
MTDQSAATDMASEERNAISRSLRRLKQQHEPNMNANELAELLIGAAIAHGFDSGSRIIGTLHALEMNRKHAGIILNRLTGMRWERHPDGRYGLLEAA